MSDDITPDGIKAIRERADEAAKICGPVPEADDGSYRCLQCETPVYIDPEYDSGSLCEDCAQETMPALLSVLSRDVLTLCDRIEELEKELAHEESERIALGFEVIAHRDAARIVADRGVREDVHARALRERDEARQWVRDLHSGMYVNCVYCGHRYGPAADTPTSMADVLTAHVETCPRHPMSALRARLFAAVAALRRIGNQCPTDPPCGSCTWCDGARIVAESDRGRE